MIISDVISLDKPEQISTIVIENQLEKIYGPLIRWAIISVTDNKLTICITYEKEV